jgi:hypothetical protein
MATVSLTVWKGSVILIMMGCRASWTRMPIAIDSIADRVEWGDDPTTPLDHDGDGLPDYLDSRYPLREWIYLPVIVRFDP